MASATSAGAGAGAAVGLSGGSGASDRAVDAALTQRGTPYSWGGGGPNGPGFGFGSGAGVKGLDCSALIQYAGAAAGMHDIPRTTYDQVKMGVGVDVSQVRKGDWVFSNLKNGKWEHVALAISSTQVVEAPKPGGHVQVSAMPSGPVAVRRVFND
ncbi:cell wall-associated hydrolase, invasion-associated protein [Mycobacteroides abscessus subsp. bolletii]|nr:cell wall-associated hydrolase, invasion-associated protein [Mycobacteroides abscessus subsp. bolletii]